MPLKYWKPRSVGPSLSRQDMPRRRMLRVLPKSFYLFVTHDIGILRVQGLSGVTRGISRVLDWQTCRAKFSLHFAIFFFQNGKELSILRLYQVLAWETNNWCHGGTFGGPSHPIWTISRFGWPVATKCYAVWSQLGLSTSNLQEM